MNRALLPTALLILLAASLAAPAQGAGFGDAQVVADLFVPVKVEALAQQPCANGAFEVDSAAQSVRFHEVDPADSMGQFAPGFFVNGCGTLSVTLAVPPGTDHLHAYFDEDRVVEEYAVPNVPLNPPHVNVDFEQRLQVQNGFGTELLDKAVFAADAPTTNRTAVVVEPGVPMAGVANVTLLWTFTDASSITSTLAFAPQGEAYGATLTAPQVEFSSIPLAYVAQQQTARRGSQLLDERSFEVVVPSALTHADVRLRLEDRFVFTDLVAPDGQSIAGFTTRSKDGPAGFDRGRILQEHYLGVSQITIPWEIVQSHGAGTWAVRVQDNTVRGEVQTPLAILSILLLLIPVPLAIVALRDIRVFEREAFGGYRRTARRLRLTVFAVSSYYLVFTLAAFVAGQLGEMTVLPLSTEGIFLYLNIGLAVLSFVTILLTARELYRMTVPRLPEARP